MTEDRTAKRSMRGMVKWYDPRRGRGVIMPEKGRGSTRLYRSAIEEAGLVEKIRDGVVVDFDLVDSGIGITGQIAGNLRFSEGNSK